MSKWRSVYPISVEKRCNDFRRFRLRCFSRFILNEAFVARQQKKRGFTGLYDTIRKKLVSTAEADLPQLVAVIFTGNESSECNQKIPEMAFYRVRLPVIIINARRYVCVISKESVSFFLQTTALNMRGQI